MSTARRDLADHLAARLPARTQVVAGLSGLENSPGPVVFVSRSSVAPAPVVGHRDDGLTVYVLTALLDPIAAVEDLDDVLDDVLAALDAHDYLHWASATLTTFADQYYAYEVQLTHRTVITTEETP